MSLPDKNSFKILKHFKTWNFEVVRKKNHRENLRYRKKWRLSEYNANISGHILRICKAKIQRLLHS